VSRFFRGVAWCNPGFFENEQRAPRTNQTRGPVQRRYRR
jgi:hypothetical protein